MSIRGKKEEDNRERKGTRKKDRYE